MANPVVESAMARNGPDTPGGINNPGEDMGGSLTVLMAGLLGCRRCCCCCCCCVLLLVVDVDVDVDAVREESVGGGMDEFPSGVEGISFEGVGGDSSTTVTMASSSTSSSPTSSLSTTMALTTSIASSFICAAVTLLPTASADTVLGLCILLLLLMD